MGKTYTLGLAGESFRNADGSSRQAEIGRLRSGDHLRLVRKEGNAHDLNAILVLSGRGVGVGMISRDDAEWLADIIDDGRSVAAVVNRVCQADGTRSKGVVIDCHIDGGSEPIRENKGLLARLFRL